MFASSPGSLAKRKGIVLVVVLGMLGLMALIGVTFATFAGQSLIASRNFNQGVGRPQAEALMDYALAQLINDTNNPSSAIRGHSLLRDMYGNDSVFRGANPTANPAAETGGLLSLVYVPGNTNPQPLVFTGYQPQTNGNNGGTTAFYNQYQYSTNIPTSGQYYGIDFTRWLVRIPGNGASQANVPQTYEILEDDTSGAVHVFTLASNLIIPTQDQSIGGNPPPPTSGDWTSLIYGDANLGAAVNLTANPPTVSKGFTSLAKELNGSGGLSGNNTSFAFVLDGRYMRAFNGAGLTQIDSVGLPANSNTGRYPYNFAAYGNFRINGSLLNGNTSFSAIPGDPDSIGMDEDYDACDLENWFLAIQSADGQVVVPSFHRPGILTGPNSGGSNYIHDWIYNSPAHALGTNQFGNPKILRPRQADNSPLFPADPSTPDPVTGQLTYDIDNDGDGVTDSVWVDLGYSIQRDPGGKLYKPLFAFMVLGTNGRLPLNTVGNLQARAIGDQTNTSGNGQNATPGPPVMPAPSVINTNMNGSATTQVPLPGPYPTPSASPDSSYFNGQLSSQVYLDAPLWDHTSHSGFSVNEINPKFALQNAPANLYPSGAQSAYGAYPATIASIGETSGASYTQYDNVGMNVALTQLRNILAGTVPTDVLQTLTSSNLKNGVVDITTLPTTPANLDVNFVVLNNTPYILPNNVADGGDAQIGNIAAIARNRPVVAGRWGEPSGIPKFLPFVSNLPTYFGNSSGTPPPGPIAYPGFWFNNPVRAGRSYFNGGANDGMDDDFDALDPVLANASQIPLGTYNNGNPYTIEQSAAANGNTLTPYQLPLNTAATLPNPLTTFTRSLPEFVDFFDGAGQRSVASERIRMFTTPQDPSGAGRLVDFNNRPNTDHDYGKGADSRGRAGYFRYFRPAGMPQEVRYPYVQSGTTTFPYPYITGSGLGQQYLMPMLLPAGYSTTGTGGPASKSDIHTNRYHGYQAALTPYVGNMANPPTNSQVVASMASMPFDWDTNGNWGRQTMPAAGPGFPTGYAYTYDATMGTAKPFNINLLAPTIAPINASASPPLFLNSTVNSSSWGPNLTFGYKPATYVLGYTTSETAAVEANLPATVVNGYPGTPFIFPNNITSSYYAGSSLNVDEADEMNLYNPSLFDQPYGPSDLEWLYRLQDVDGATLSSRLAQLAPVSFSNPADGLTRRRLFSTDSWDLNRFAYANDNPGGQFPYNSRFLPNASPSLENLNQVVATNNGFNQAFANPYTTEFIPNPTLPPAVVTVGNNTFVHNDISNFIPNESRVGTPIPLPQPLTPNSNTSLFTNAFGTATISNGVVVPFGNGSTFQVQTPSVAHGDRKINLNFPLPISNDPAEPIRQKWCRETYQLLKSILPPASIDTPEELAALSQFVVNIVDFRDTDCTMTRFVNTDLEVTDVLTKQSTNYITNDPPVGKDLTWSVSPGGVKFATSNIPIDPITNIQHFPYDPSIYNPDGYPLTVTTGVGSTTIQVPTTFLVQHGMEYNPVAINEVMAYQSPYGSVSMGMAKYQAFFVELVNTLTQEQNNSGATSNASAISLEGWDIVVAPDDFGWGRPDPVSGEINPIALPPWTPNPGGSATMPPSPFSTANTTSQKPFPKTTDPNLINLYQQVQQFSIPNAPASSFITPLNGTTYNPFIIGDYRDSTMNGDPSINMSGLGTYVSPVQGWGTASINSSKFEGTNPIVITNRNQKTTPTPPTLNVQLPATFTLPTPVIPMVTPATTARYYWVYLRRPANPFDVAPVNQVRPNKEMVVVDCVRFPVIDAGPVGMPTAATPPTLPGGAAPNQVYSAQRLQPFRGGHLVRVDTPASLPSSLPTSGPASGVKTICPPSPPHAYGYSEQISLPASMGNVTTGVYQYTTGGGGNGYLPLTKLFKESINATNTNLDTAWGHIPINDRDFSSVAELLLVPGCPPGLFTKQFIEEPYPGNIFSNTTAPFTVATGTDYRDFQAPVAGNYGLLVNTASVLTPPPIVGPPGTPNNPSLSGRVNFPGFAMTAPSPPFPTYPYLSDNFYYTAASVSPPASGNNLDAKYLNLTTEIGGWTGAGWHKMLEFFEVPSSANGAIGTADNGNNYDWARSDIKPGLINLNLVIDEEVFAGLMDDPRLNENLAFLTSAVPAVVTQVDVNGYPASNGSTGYLFGQQSIYNGSSTNILLDPIAGTGNVVPVTLPAGRGYSLRDPNLFNYPNGTNVTSPPTVFPPQQVHGIKAAFCDFLKLRHGGSGFLFAYGNGIVGSGDYPTPPPPAANPPYVYPITLNASTNPPFPALQQSLPVAAERPYRSLSYPDINYTVMRPASLPPTAIQTNGNTVTFPGTIPPLPVSGEVVREYPTNFNTMITIGHGLESLLQYGVGPGAPYFVQYQPLLAPMNQSLLGGAPAPPNYQYVYDPGLKNPFLPIQYVNQQSPQNMPAGTLRLAPPYATPVASTPPVVTPAPFPPPIPPTPARRLFQIPDHGSVTDATTTNISNANVSGGYDGTQNFGSQYAVNQPTIPQQLSTGIGTLNSTVAYSIPYPTNPTTLMPNDYAETPPNLVSPGRAVFKPDNYTPQAPSTVGNLLGSGGANDYRQHPLYRTEWLQKVMNLTTVRTHQFAVWITVGFFEVVKQGTPELGIPDVLGQELGITAGKNVRYRSFFTLDRTKATGFNPYYPGNFRDCVTYRRRIE